MGVFLNISWHFFLASVIGWGDSAPDWYFYRQETIFVCIFLIGLIGWIIFSLRIKKKPMAYITIPTKKELTEGLETIREEALR